MKTPAAKKILATLEASPWLPVALILCIPYLLGADGGELLPIIYTAANMLTGWVGSRTGVAALRKELTGHVNDGTVHTHRRATDVQPGKPT